LKVPDRVAGGYGWFYITCLKIICYIVPKILWSSLQEQCG
jgi:hypothetical protein